MNHKELYNSIFDYNDGVLFHKSTGKQAGNKNDHGYVVIQSEHLDKRIASHRIIYTMFHGHITREYDIHHIDGDKTNNRIENLAAVKRDVHNFFGKSKPAQISKVKKGQWFAIRRFRYIGYKFTDKTKKGVKAILDQFHDDILHERDLSKYDKYITIRHFSYDKSTVIDKDFLIQHYNYVDGDLISKKTGKKLGHLAESGYVQVKLKGIHKALHILVYIYHYGDIPKNLVIDHIDQNRSNNRIENLRLADKHFNAINTKRPVVAVPHSNGGWTVRVKRRDQIFSKYFNKDKYNEAVSFAVAVNEARQDLDRIKELYTLVI